jgi:hypothetical protein
MDDCNWLEAMLDHNFCVYFNVIAKIYVYHLCDKPLTSNKTNKFKIEYDDGYVIQNTRRDKELPICIDIGGQIISRDMTGNYLK